MKRFAITILAAASVARAGGVAEYGWRISGSDADPFLNSGDVPAGRLSLCLWLQCTVGDGVSAAEFDLAPPTGVIVLSFAPRNGFLNAGDPEHLALAVGGCPTGPVLVGEWQLAGAAAGSYCLAAGGTSGMVGTADCLIRAEMHPSHHVGYGAGELPACDEHALICATTAVRPAGWGRIKSLYR